MRLRDYFGGYALVMQSRLRPDEVERRINAATLSGWRLFQEGVSGWARFGRIRLRYRTRFVHYGGAPILAGRIDDEFGLTRLTLRYRSPLPIYAFFIFWYAFMLLFLVVSAGAATAWSERAPALAAVGLFLIAPLAMHYVFTRDADAHFDSIVRFLEKSAEAKVVSGGRRREL